MSDKTVGCVIVNYNSAELSVAAAHNIISAGIDNVIIIDNNSVEEDYKILSGSLSKNIDLIRSESNNGYGTGNNMGIRELVNRYNVDYILICNPDTIIDKESIKTVLECFEKHPDAALVAPRAVNSEGKTYNSCWHIPSTVEYIYSMCALAGVNTRIKYYNTPASGCIEVECVSGALLFLDAKKFMSIGMYDENIFLYCEETVIGIKLRANKMNSYLTCDAFYTHNHIYSDASNSEIYRQTKRTLRSRYYVLKQYLGASAPTLFLAKCIYLFIPYEQVLINTIKKIKSRL